MHAVKGWQSNNLLEPKTERKKILCSQSDIRLSIIQFDNSFTHWSVKKFSHIRSANKVTSKDV